MNVVKTFAALAGLASVHRYSMVILGRPESVLEHVGMVALVATILGHEANLLSPMTVNLSQIALKALVHDLDELIVGDVPRPTKYFSRETRAMFREIEERGVRKVCREMDLSERFQEIVFQAHSESKVHREGFVVAVADVMAVVYKIWEEVLVRGNMGMTHHASNVIPQINKMIGEISSHRFDPRVVALFEEVLGVCRSLMVQASELGNDVHGSISEEMVQ